MHTHRWSVFLFEEMHENPIDQPCTSKPCFWNKPSKRTKEWKTKDQMNFKKYKQDLDQKRNTVQMKTNDRRSFCESLCSR